MPLAGGEGVYKNLLWQKTFCHSVRERGYGVVQKWRHRKIEIFGPLLPPLSPFVTILVYPLSPMSPVQTVIKTIKSMWKLRKYRRFYGDVTTCQYLPSSIVIISHQFVWPPSLLPRWRHFWAAPSPKSQRNRKFFPYARHSMDQVPLDNCTRPTSD